MIKITSKMKELGHFIAAILVAAMCCTGTILPLQKVYTPTQIEDTGTIVARDRARNTHIIGSFPVTGGVLSTSGLYSTRISLGTPPKEYKVMIDTGSDLLWVTCKGCTDCPQHADTGIQMSFFDTANSTTAASCPNPPCEFSYGYVGGSLTSGHLITDMLYLASATNSSASRSVRVTFGCSTRRTGLLAGTTRVVDGIFGLGHSDDSVLSQLQNQGIGPHVFTHCLIGDAAGGGFLVLGEVVHPNIQYTPLIPSQPFYNVDLQSITINGQHLSVGSMTMNGIAGTIFDSGTSMTYLSQDVYDSFAATINKAISQYAQPHMSGGDLCYTPTSRYYVIQDGSSQSCLGIYPASPDGFPVIGEISMKDKIVVYDMYQKRVGWADYNCRLPYNLSTSDKGQSSRKEGRTWILTHILILAIFWYK